MTPCPQSTPRARAPVHHPCRWRAEAPHQLRRRRARRFLSAAAKGLLAGAVDTPPGDGLRQHRPLSIHRRRQRPGRRAPRQPTGRHGGRKDAELHARGGGVHRRMVTSNPSLCESQLYRQWMVENQLNWRCGHRKRLQ